MHGAMGRATARELGASWKDFTWRRVCEDEAYAVSFFKAWDSHVRRVVPAAQLLEFETGKDDYKALATFLGVPLPKGSPAYPRSNSAAEFSFVINLVRVLAVLTCLVPLVMLRVAMRVCGCGGVTGSSTGKTKVKGN